MCPAGWKPACSKRARLRALRLGHPVNTRSAVVDAVQVGERVDVLLAEALLNIVGVVLHLGYSVDPGVHGGVQRRLGCDHSGHRYPRRGQYRHQPRLARHHLGTVGDVVRAAHPYEEPFLAFTVRYRREVGLAPHDPAIEPAHVTSQIQVRNASVVTSLIAPPGPRSTIWRRAPQRLLSGVEGPRADHVGRHDPSIEIRRRDAAVERGLTQRAPTFEGVLRDHCRRVIAHMRSQGRDEHEVSREVLADS